MTDDQGRRLHFHALRKTLGTRLARHRVSSQIVSRIMRHSDLNITMKLYTDLRLVDSARALDDVPAIGLRSQTKTVVAMGRGNDDQRAAPGAGRTWPNQGAGGTDRQVKVSKKTFGKDSQVVIMEDVGSDLPDAGASGTADQKTRAVSSVG